MVSPLQPRSKFGGVLLEEPQTTQQPTQQPTSQFGGQFIQPPAEPQIPAGPTPEQMERKRKFAAQRKEIMAQKMKELAEESGIGEAAAVSFANGLLNAWHGTKEIYAKVTGDDALMQGVQQDRADAEEMMAPLREEHPVATFVGEAAGEMAPFAPIGVVGAGVKSLAGRMIGGAIAGGVEAGVLSGGKAGATTAGAGLGAGAEAAMTLFAPRIARVFKAMTGKAMRKAPIVGGRINKEVAEELQQQGISLEDLAAGVEDSINRDLYPDLDDMAQFRQSRAEEFGFDLPAGAAQKDFAAQEAESVVMGSPTEAGAAARAIASERSADVLTGARERLLGKMKSSVDLDFEDKASNFSKREFGRLMKASAQELKTRDKGVINGLYKMAKEMPGEDVPLNANSLEEAFLDAIDEIEPDERTLKSIKKTLAKYGVIGEAGEKKGLDTIIDFDGEKLKVRGDTTPYSLNNAEELRQRLNKAFRTDDTGLVGILKRHLDNDVADTIDAVSEAGEMAGVDISPEKIAKYQEARNAYRKYKSDYEAGDIVQDILAVKRGTESPKIAEEELFNKVFKSSRKVENIKRIKWALKNNPTPASEQTWADMGAVAVEDLLKQSVSPDGTLSGARLNTAINKMSDDALEELLDKQQFRDLKAFQQALGDLTIPLARTQNVSESGQRVLNMLFRVFDMKTMGIGGVVKRSAEKKAARGQLMKGLESIRGTTGKTRLQKGAEVMGKALTTLAAGKQAVPEEEE